MSDRSADLLQLAEDDPAGCVAESKRLIGQATSSEAVAAAHWAMGVALRNLGRLEESRAALVSARDLYQDLEMDDLAEDASISLAASIAVLGELTEALAMLRPLVSSSHPLVRAHAQVQLAGLLARTGDFDEALDLYATAEPTLRSNEDRRWLALLSSTRGLVHTYRGEFDDAERDVRYAIALYRVLHRDSSVAMLTGNLGFMYLMMGDIPAGLSTLLEADELFRAAGLPPEANSTARAYGYMLAGLPKRACEVLADAARSLQRAGRELEYGEALVLLARAALTADDLPLAIDVANTAMQLRSMADREGWRMQLELVEADARVRHGEEIEQEALNHLAGRFVELDNYSGAAQACVTVALGALQIGNPAEADRGLALLETFDMTIVELPIRARADATRARVKLAQADEPAAVDALANAADMIDHARLVASATESRAGLSRLSEEIAATGLEVIGEGQSVVEWLERFRSSSLRIAPVVPSRNPEIAASLAELRRWSRDHSSDVLAGRGSVEAARKIRHLESRIRDMALAHPDASVMAPGVEVHEIRALLQGRQMVYFYDRGRVVMAEILGPAGSKTVEVGRSAGIRMLARHLLSGMRRSFVNPERSDSRRTAESLSELGETLLGQVGESAGTVVIPPPDLLALPWNAMAAERTEIAVSPSASMWARAEQVRSRPGNTLVAAGPRLSHASREAQRVAGAYDEAVVLDGTAATVQAVLEAMEESSTFHAVAHGRLRQDNPMFSALELADGDLSLYSLESVEHAPTTVVLSACDSAHGNVLGGQEMLGLSSVLLGRGARSIVATVAPIPDSEASVAAVERLHLGLRAGLSPAAALRDVQSRATGVSGVDPSLAFVVYGAF